MRVLFEDNPKASISQLLLQVDKSLYFSCGNNNIMRDVIASDTVDIVYLDVMPDNYKTVNIFNSLINKVNENMLPKIIIPVPCIEYFCICCWLESEPHFKNTLLTYWQSPYNFRGRKLSTISVETFCKSFLSGASNCFKQNVRTDKNFYQIDCKCPPVISLCNKKLTVQQKAKDLYSSLPVTTLKVSNSDEEIASIQQLIKIIMQWYSFYDLLTQSFIKHGKISAKADYSLRRLWWC